MERPPLSSSSPMLVARGLAEALLAGPWRGPEIINRAALALGRRRRWIPPLAARLIAAFGEGTRPTTARVVAFLLQDDAFRLALQRGTLSLSADRPRPEMAPAPGGPSGWAALPIRSADELATWAGLDPAALAWFADLRGLARRAPAGPLRHYDAHWVVKRDGTRRLIEVPRPRLKALQRRLLDEVLAPIPPHEAAHGFRPGHSVRTFVAPHVGRRVVLKLDLRDFFASISAARVVALFHTAGYPEPVARLLAGLCTTGAPPDAWDLPGAPGPAPDAWHARRRLAAPHLPQGAPTSPALANLVAYRLDLRLAALAASGGASYSRYADDLAFSGDREFERSVRRFAVRVMAVALEEGFVVHPRKTRVMHRGDRQRLAGVIVNDRPNVDRRDFDALKATLHNCVRFGPSGQDRLGLDDFRAHLAGRVAHVASIHPERGERLRAIFDRIAW